VANSVNQYTEVSHRDHLDCREVDMVFLDYRCSEYWFLGKNRPIHDRQTLISSILIYYYRINDKYHRDV
jgi:hypothetical protein